MDVLLVPIYLDALYLKEDSSVAGPMADFSRRPFKKGRVDVNPDVANLSEEILSQPFDAQSLQLKAGIHLHWALPDALTRGYLRKETRSIEFPSLPNRWLVTRTGHSSRKQWIVESDYLGHPDRGNPYGGVSFPYSEDDGQFSFRYLGRSLSLAAWRESLKDNQRAEYLKHLTAIGYGEPSFAAFYPNCLNVFGLHDANPPEDLAGVQYDIVGWYSRPEQDCLRFWALKEAIAGLQFGKLKDVYQWTLKETDPYWSVKDTDAFAVERTLYYAKLTFGKVNSEPKLQEQRELAIAVGNTSTEALSAYLSDFCGRNKKLKEKIPNPEHLEDQLEAVQLLGRLQGRQADIGPKFFEARHNKEFTGVQAGTLWAVRQENTDLTKVNAASSAAQGQINLPQSIADLLHRLNDTQQVYDRDCDEIDAKRKQLFSDWYKYMLTIYPPEGDRNRYPNPDEARYFLGKNGLMPLKQRLIKNKMLKRQLDQRVAELKSGLVRLNAAEGGTYSGFVLKPVAAPRYWQPNEPVLLLVDEHEQSVKATVRHGHDGLLKCHILNLEDSSIENQFDTIRPVTFNLYPDDNIDRLGSQYWTMQPWNPFLLEWEVEVLPIRGKYQKPSAGEAPDTSAPHDYDARCILDNYQFNGNAVDYTIKPGREQLAKESTCYSGRSILTPHAKFQMLNQIKYFLENELLDDYYAATQVKPEERSNDYFEQHLQEIIGWAKIRADPVLNQILAIFDYLNQKDGEEAEFHLLAQSLSGFNEALLMHKQTLQLPIDDPLGFDSYRAFTQAVNEAAGDGTRSAPQPKNDFNPIRTGVLKIHQLQLVDTFGQIQAVRFQENEVITTDAMTAAASPHLTVLPPRIVQPARMHFRWLAADEGFTLDEYDDPEMNSHPASSPVCGWLLPNYLDNSLMVYDAKGRALGSVTQFGKWAAAPGAGRGVAVWPLPNPHLHRTVQHIIHKGPAYLDNFMTVIENALDNIEPESAAQHESLALLAGRPVALVRAKLNLELQGEPAIDQSWSAFRQDLELAIRDNIIERDTRSFTGVSFPIRIGDYKQLNDGLVGYWHEQGDLKEFNQFYAPQSDLKAESLHPDIIAHTDNSPAFLYQSISSPPQTLTMLMDPRGCVHAACGILPAKAIHIPPEHYTEALRNIEVTFLTAPILTERGKINLPLPDEPGHVWSWMDKENGAWENVSEIGKASTQAILTSHSELREGWLKLTGTDSK